MSSNFVQCKAPGDSPWAQTDRRLLPRVATRLVVKIYSLGLPAALMGQARDLGPGGICVETASPFALDSLRRVSVEFPGRTLQLKVAGQWQRNAPGRNGVLTGMSFIELDASETEYVWTYVYQRAGELASFLRDRSQLAGIHYDDAVDLTFFTRLVQFPAGDFIYRQGSLGTRGDSAFILYRGRVLVEARSEAVGSVYLEHVEEGGVFGGMPMLAAVPHPDTAIAETDVLVLEIDPYSYRHLEGSRPRAVRCLSQALVRRYAGRLDHLVERASMRPRPILQKFKPEQAAADAVSKQQSDPRAGEDGNP